MVYRLLPLPPPPPPSFCYNRDAAAAAVVVDVERMMTVQSVECMNDAGDWMHVMVEAGQRLRSSYCKLRPLANDVLTAAFENIQKMKCICVCVCVSARVRLPQPQNIQKYKRYSLI